MTDPGVGGHRVRSAALRVLIRVDRGRRSDRSLDEVLSRSGMDSRDRALCTEIVYGTLRRRGTIDRTLALHCARPIESLDPPVRAALRMAVYQCGYLRSVPAHAAVHRSVEALKRAWPRAAGFANGVLRSWLRSGGELDGGDGSLGAIAELPPWLADRWTQRASVESAAWLAATLEPPRLALRVSAARSSAPEVIARIVAAGGTADQSPVDPLCVRATGSGDALAVALQDGGAVPRSEATQLVTTLLDVDGRWTLDACSGRGGKTRQLLDCGARQVVAVDRHFGRLRDAVDLTAHTGAPKAFWVRADLERQAPVLRDFPRILVDVPCSGLGTIRRHPEIKWLVGPQDLERHAAQQRRILAAMLDCLEPGGVLLYVTCSSEPEENEDVVEACLRDRPEYRRAPPEMAPPGLAIDGRGDVRSFPLDPALDGLYAARLTRAAG